jgi:hypothetical protein
MLDVPSVSDSIVGFHAQQAVEKALKAGSGLPPAASSSRSPISSQR